MRPAGRRRQDRQQTKTDRVPDTSAVRVLLNEGSAHLQGGRLQEAERTYRLALNMAPDHPEALHLLGLSLYRLNRFDDAMATISRAIEQAPSAPLYWFNFGVVAQKAARPDEAIRAYRQAVTLNPRHLEAWSNLGNVLRDRGALPESIDAYQKALALNPSHPDTHNNLGVALKEQGQVPRAIASYRQAIQLKPTHVEALNNLGLALMETGSLNEAIASFTLALTIMPGYLKALYNLGIARSWAGEDEKAVDCLQRAATAKHDHARPVTDSFVYRSRIKHDLEQIQHLFGRHLLSDEHRPYLQALQRLRDELDRLPNPGNRVPITPQDLAPVAASFNRLLYRPSSPHLPAGALHPALDVESVESRYLAKQPEVTWIDGLLNLEALEALRRFCWESTMWKKDYENGYIGAFLGDGFASPLLLQIAEELRLKFPRIFKQHRLTQAWAFKHDSARRGLNIHADAAAVNVNFWITPDEANLNPETGGLVVYDKEAPRDWNFQEYNSDKNKPKILAWLDQVGAKTVKIPYRTNRAVVFNSDLFHETDEIAFKDDYLSRRINITLLYGYRSQG
ncbi:MAG: tetratricopeptide repeat protein [Nitrospirota bacterium]|nr:tetratricopeptide repeat protein [Nitrospirota bacterium]